MRRSLLHILLAAALALFACQNTSAQFKEQAFSQSYNDDVTSSDSVEVLFSIPEYLGGLRHQNEIGLGTSFAGSTILIGGQQIYNKQYWKLPFVYGSIAAGVGGGLYFNNVYKQTLDGGLEPNTRAKNLSTALFTAAGVAYWATLLDGAVSYKPNDYPQPTRAMVYSILLPGLGQMYNGEYWKLPIYWGGLMGSFHFYALNKKNYERFKMIYNRSGDPEWTEPVPISKETALFYRDTYRRMRDYSIVAILGVYLVQIIDANVFAFMHNFDTSDDFALSVSPTLIAPDNQFAFSASDPAFGLRLGFTF